jgi:hypothetical protein
MQMDVGLPDQLSFRPLRCAKETLMALKQGNSVLFLRKVSHDLYGRSDRGIIRDLKYRGGMFRPKGNDAQPRRGFNFEST